jgi:hypothetical protein
VLNDEHLVVLEGEEVPKTPNETKGKAKGKMKAKKPDRKAKGKAKAPKPKEVVKFKHGASDDDDDLVRPQPALPFETRWEKHGCP